MLLKVKVHNNLFILTSRFRNIIDVSALDTHLLEQSEYNDRVKLYAQRLAHQWNNIQVNDTKYNGEWDVSWLHCNFIETIYVSGLLKDVPNPEILLASNQNNEEISMVCIDKENLTTESSTNFSFIHFRLRTSFETLLKLWMIWGSKTMMSSSCLFLSRNWLIVRLPRLSVHNF